MTGYHAMLRTELRDITHTWRIAVIPGLLLLTAATSPILASLAPHLLATSLGTTGIHLPDPTAWDAYEQWTKNLTPLALLVVIITTSGAVNTDIGNGTAALTLTTPVSRPAYVLAKATANTLLITTSTAVATAITWTVTRAVFGPGAPLRPLILTSAAWALLATAYSSLALWLSTALPSPLAAAGAGLVILIACSTLSIWPAAARNTPAGMPTLITHLGQAQPTAGLRPLITTAVAIPLFTAAAMATLQNRDL